ncbi:MAG: aminotransferase class IV [Polyangiales bacterium]
MPDALVSLNGTIVPAAEARVPALDRGFLYGDGAFEVLRTYRGVPFCLEEHLGRLHASAARIGLTLPVPISRLRREVAELLDAAGFAEAHLRVLVTRGVGDPGVAPSNVRDPTRMIVAHALHAPPVDRYARGVRVMTVPVASLGPLAGAKTLNYLANVLWTQQARAQGFDEALLVSGDAVIEAATANVFVVTGAEVLTPALDGGALPGVTRAQLIRAAKGAGTSVREARVTSADVWTADEVFLTSSVREVVPVVAVDDHEVGSGAPGPVTRALHRAYRAETPLAGAPMPWEAP